MRWIFDWLVFLITMATLLRKVWESVSNRTCSGAEPSTRSTYAESSSLGLFDQLPTDILMHLLRLVGPKEAAKLSSVCKSWRSLVSDNRLWIYFLHNQQEPLDTIFFGETVLRSGYPIQWVIFFSSWIAILGLVWWLRKWRKTISFFFFFFWIMVV